MFTQKMIDQAQTKLWVKWKYPNNGYEKMVFYSFENRMSIQSGDLTFGASGLLKMLEKELKGKYEVAILYDKRTGAPIKKFIDGIEV